MYSEQLVNLFHMEKKVPDYFKKNVFTLGNNFLALLLCKMNVFNIFDTISEVLSGSTRNFH